MLKVRRGSGRVVLTKTGPNDARHVVWAISECFFFRVSFIYYMIFLGFFDVL